MIYGSSMCQKFELSHQMLKQHQGTAGLVSRAAHKGLLA